MNPQELDLLNAIAADREADAPRLIYADWLEDQGDPRGELVRAQCELERLPETCLRHWELTRRTEELLADHQDEWMAEFVELGVSNRFSPLVRGCVERLAMPPQVFLDSGKEIFELAPTLVAWQIDDYAKHLPALGLLSHHHPRC